MVAVSPPPHPDSRGVVAVVRGFVVILSWWRFHGRGRCGSGGGGGDVGAGGGGGGGMFEVCSSKPHRPHLRV